MWDVALANTVCESFFDKFRMCPVIASAASSVILNS